MNNIRRKDRNISEEESIELLIKGEYGVLSMCGEQEAYGIPINYVFDHDKYISIAPLRVPN